MGDVDCKKIRKALRMSQDEFCEAFGLSHSSVANWEQGISAPRGASRTYLILIERMPATIIEALGTQDKCRPVPSDGLPGLLTTNEGPKAKVVKVVHQRNLAPGT